MLHHRHDQAKKEAQPRQHPDPDERARYTESVGDGDAWSIPATANITTAACQPPSPQPGRASRFEQCGDGQNDPGGPNPPPGPRPAHHRSSSSCHPYSAGSVRLRVIRPAGGDRRHRDHGHARRIGPRVMLPAMAAPRAPAILLSLLVSASGLLRASAARANEERAQEGAETAAEPRRRPPPPSRSPTHDSARATSSTTCWCAATARPTSRSSSPRPRPLAWCRGPLSMHPTRASRRCATGCSRWVLPGRAAVGHARRQPAAASCWSSRSKSAAPSSSTSCIRAPARRRRSGAARTCRRRTSSGTGSTWAPGSSPRRRRRCRGPRGLGLRLRAVVPPIGGPYGLSLSATGLYNDGSEFYRVAGADDDSNPQQLRRVTRQARGRRAGRRQGFSVARARRPRLPPGGADRRVADPRARRRSTS